jgi:hypothetical protein
VRSLGNGAAAKLVANSTLFALLTLALGEGLCLQRDDVFEVLSNARRDELVMDAEWTQSQGSHGTSRSRVRP